MELVLNNMGLAFADQALNIMRTHVADMSNPAAVDIYMMITLRRSLDALAIG